MSFVKITEQSSLYDDLEKKSIREILTEINQEDQKVALAVQRVIPQIEELVAGIVKRMRRGVGSSILARVPADGWGYWTPPRYRPPLACPTPTLSG